MNASLEPDMEPSQLPDDAAGTRQIQLEGGDLAFQLRIGGTAQLNVKIGTFHEAPEV